MLLSTLTEASNLILNIRPFATVLQV